MLRAKHELPLAQGDLRGCKRARALRVVPTLSGLWRAGVAVQVLTQCLPGEQTAARAQKQRPKGQQGPLEEQRPAQNNDGGHESGPRCSAPSSVPVRGGADSEPTVCVEKRRCPAGNDANVARENASVNPEVARDCTEWSVRKTDPSPAFNGQSASSHDRPSSGGPNRFVESSDRFSSCSGTNQPSASSNEEPSCDNYHFSNSRLQSTLDAVGKSSQGWCECGSRVGKAAGLCDTETDERQLPAQRGSRGAGNVDSLCDGVVDKNGVGSSACTGNIGGNDGRGDDDKWREQGGREQYDCSRSTEDAYRADHRMFTERFREARSLLDYTYHSNYVLSRQEVQDHIIESALRTSGSREDASKKMEMDQETEGKADGGGEEDFSSSTGLPDRPWAVFTAGAMGAGKSHVMRLLEEQGIFPMKAFVQIDPDRLRRELPEMQAYLKQDQETAGSLTHKEAGLMAEILEETALLEGRNILVDGSLRDGVWYAVHVKDLRRRFPRLRVAIIHVWAPEEVVVERAARRAEQTGRTIPPSILLETVRAIPASVEKLAPLADYCVRIDNTGSDAGTSQFLLASHERQSESHLSDEFVENSVENISHKSCKECCEEHSADSCRNMVYAAVEKCPSVAAKSTTGKLLSSAEISEKNLEFRTGKFEARSGKPDLKSHGSVNMGATYCFGTRIRETDDVTKVSLSTATSEGIGERSSAKFGDRETDNQDTSVVSVRGGGMQDVRDESDLVSVHPECERFAHTKAFSGKGDGHAGFVPGVLPEGFPVLATPGETWETLRRTFSNRRDC